MGVSNELKPMGVALIGAGMIAKSHILALSAASDKAQLHAIVSRRPERAEPLAVHYSGTKPLFTSELSDVINNPEIQMVIIATPPSVRNELIATLAKAGKHILLEKPVARSMSEATQVVEICERAGVTLGVLFQHRMRAPSLLVTQLLKSGEFGTLSHIDIEVPLWREQSYYDELGRGTYARDGGGVLLTQAIHTIDLALSFMGPVKSVQAMTATTALHQMETEDFAVVGLRFTSGAVGSLVASTATFPHGKEMITLHSKRGSLRLGTDTLMISWRDGRSEDRMFGMTDVGETGPIVDKYKWHQSVIEDFIDAIHNKRPPLVTGRQALLSQGLIDAIETSSKTGRVIDIIQ